MRQTLQIELMYCLCKCHFFSLKKEPNQRPLFQSISHTYTYHSRSIAEKQVHLFLPVSFHQPDRDPHDGVHLQWFAEHRLSARRATPLSLPAHWHEPALRGHRLCRGPGQMASQLGLDARPSRDPPCGRRALHRTMPQRSGGASQPHYRPTCPG